MAERLHDAEGRIDELSAAPERAEASEMREPLRKRTSQAAARAARR